MVVSCCAYSKVLNFKNGHPVETGRRLLIVPFKKTSLIFFDRVVSVLLFSFLLLLKGNVFN